MSALSLPPTRARPARPWLLRTARTHGQEIVILLALAVLFGIVGSINGRFLGANNLAQHLLGQCLYRGRGDRDGGRDHHGQHRRLGRGSDRGARRRSPVRWPPGGIPIWIAWTVPIIVGIVIDAHLSGLLVAYAKIPSIVVTLGMLSILQAAG